MEETLSVAQMYERLLELATPLAALDLPLLDAHGATMASDLLLDEKVAIKSGTKINSTKKMNYYETILSKHPFYKLHRSHFVNLNKIREIIKNEGDGMVVAEAIIRNYSVLLAENSDLRRFNLPNSNYFLDQSDLTDKLATWKMSKGAAFAVPENIISSMISERDLEVISKRWNALLSQFAIRAGQ